MPSVQIGAFSVGVARLSRYGNIEYNGLGGATEVTDVYTVVMGRGVIAHRGNVTGLPAPNTQHPTLTNLRIEKYTFLCKNENTGVWEISVKYAVISEKKSTQLDPEDPENPPEEPDVVVQIIKAKSWDSATCNIDLTSDAEDGKPVINSAGDTFDSVPQRVITSPSVSFTRLEKRHPKDVMKYNGTINKSIINVMGIQFQPRCAKIKISCTETFDESEDALPYEYTYTVEGRNLFVTLMDNFISVGWDEVMIEQGFHYLDDSGEKQKFMITIESTGEEREASSPQLLTEDGKKNTEKKPVFRRIASCESEDWNTLDLLTD